MMKKLIYSQEDLDLIFAIETQEIQEKIDKAINVLQELFNLYKDTPYYDVCDMVENAIDILKGEE